MRLQVELVDIYITIYPEWLCITGKSTKTGDVLESGNYPINPPPELIFE